jgi:hypothetical protein
MGELWPCKGEDGGICRWGVVAKVMGEWWNKELPWGMHKVCASGGNTVISRECGVSCVGVVA